ncbi:unnamed protein product [Phytophthora lilii]|uniref:Unnamed protein product n=1 Tax=Phytophthora lilii TaxID=2077276 RepID=A0A9W6TH70_9STRA|nr:unnamed protein product [Phytophthora lilii]
MLSAEKVDLQKHAKQVLRREMDATRQLALAAKSSGGNSISSSHKFLSQSQKVSSRSFVEGAPASVNRFHKTQVVYRKRPRADGSKIPYPAATLKSSAACVDIE